MLAGGGARASFEIGALQYLYRHQNLDPDVISGTSAGAILATALAQHSSSIDQAQTLDRLEAIFIGLQDSQDMFAEQPWFSALRGHIPTWRKAMVMRQRQANRVSLSESLQDLVARPREAVARIAGDRPSAERPQQPPERRPPQEAPSGERTPPEHSSRWTPVHALETVSTLWEVGRSSTDLDLIARGAQQERAAFKPGRIFDYLTDPQTFSVERMQTSDVTLRLAVVSLETGELRYVDQNGMLRDRQDRVLPDLGPVGPVEATLASCSIPGVFPPVLMAGEHYVDGGIRENVPAAVVLDHHDLDRCYIVVAAPDGVPATTSFADRDLMEILMRTTAVIMPDELQREEIAYASRRGAVVIQPELDIHDMVTIDPGLSSIAIDYGYLRAGDVCEGADATRSARTRDVIQLRRLIWTTEDQAFRPHDPHDASPAEPFSRTAATESEQEAVQEIAELKVRLRDLIADPGSAHLPPTADSWWRTWERHAFTIEAEPTWPGSYRE